MQLQALKNYQEKSIILDSLPLVIHLESVKGCPFDCSMCNYGNTKPVDLPKSLLEKLEPYYKALEVLTIHGEGEPLVSNNLDYFVQKSNENQFVLHMNTTGALLTDEKIKILSKAYGLSIRFSIHAGKPETYKKIMGVDLIDVSLKIKKLVDLSSGMNCDFWFSFIVMKENVNEIEEFLELAHSCGIKSVRFMHLYPTIENIKGVTKRDFYFNYFEQSSQGVVQAFIDKWSVYRNLH
jgi:MoaA/NifB/PqqE/SkfB family radical SAM enzyme